MFIIFPLRLINIYILANYLNSEIYAVASILLSIVGLIFMFGQLGTNNRILSRDLSFDQVMNSFNLNIVISLLLVSISILFCVFIYPFNFMDSYSGLELIFLVLTVSFGFFFQNLYDINNSILLKDLKNNTIGLLKISSSAVSTFTSVFLAINYKSIYSLLLPLLISNFLLFVISGIYLDLFRRYKFDSLLSFRINSDDIKFSFNALVSNINNYLSNNILNLFGISKIPLNLLGQFNFSKSLSTQLSDITWNNFSFFFPILKKLSNLNNFESIYKRILSKIFFFTSQLYLIFIIFSPLIFSNFFPKFMGTGQLIFIIILLPNLFKPLSLFANNILFLNDKKRYGNVISTLRVLLIFISYFIGIYYNDSIILTLKLFSLSEILIILIYFVVSFFQISGHLKFKFSHSHFIRLTPLIFLISIFFLVNILHFKFEIIAFSIFLFVLLFLNYLNLDFIRRPLFTDNI